MFDFNKRDSSAKDESFDPEDLDTWESGNSKPAPSRQTASSGRREAAVIGPSIHINGDLRGEEDLLIEGEVKGTVSLRHNALTIGGQGKVTADVYANNITVDGYMKGDLYGAERVYVRKSAEVHGNIISPRVSLEDGARFKGAIEMDPESEALQKIFADKRGNGKTAAFPGKSSSSDNKSSSDSKSSSSDTAGVTTPSSVQPAAAQTLTKGSSAI